MAQKIKLDFGDLILDAEIFDNREVGRKFIANIPYSINELTKWGR